MRICVPTENSLGTSSDVYGHFGSAKYFTVYDTDKICVEVIDNSDQDHAHGMCQFMTVLEGKDIDMVVCNGMGARAVQKLNQAGIKVFKTSAAKVEGVIAQHKEGKLEELTIAQACSEHDCH